MIGLFLDPEQELIFQSRIECDRTLSGSRTSTAWLESDCLAGLWNGTGESDRCDRTLLGSGTGTYVSESDRCDRTLSGSRTSTAWLDLLLGWTSSAWQESGTELVSRIDVIGLFLNPEQELIFQSRIDVIGLLVDPGPRQLGWTPTAWLESAWLDSAGLDSAWLDSGTGTEKLEGKQLVGTSGKWFP